MRPIVKKPIVDYMVKSKTMKTLLLPILCLLAFAASAQDLLNSRQSGVYSYIYRITNEEAEGICRFGYGAAKPDYFHTLIDSFYTDSLPVFDLPQGHYLKTSIQEGELIAEVLTVPALQVVLFNNSADLCLAVQDSLGQPIPDVVVKAGRKRIRFDKKTQLYHLAKANKEGILTIEHDGFETWYSLSRRWNNPGWKRALNSKPLRYVWRPIRFAGRLPVDAVRSVKHRRPERTIGLTRNFFKTTYENAACWLNEENCDAQKFESQWQGYFVFNKPKYLPGDTVKYKAFLIDKKGRPSEDSVTVVFSNNRKPPKNLGRIAPYCPGGYAGEFVLHDSLGLQLDKSCEVKLQKDKYRTYIRGAFRYEDYELHSIALAVRSEAKRHFRGDDFVVFLKGTDENDLNLADARVEMVLRPLKTLGFHATALFLPDTLWKLAQPLEPSGETAIAIPDSIFPPLNVEYELLTTMLTSDNERKTDRQVFTFYYLLEEPIFELIGDSIRFTFQRNGKSVPASGKLRRFDATDYDQPPKLVELPHQEKLNTHLTQYELDVNGIYREFFPAQKPAMLRVLSERGIDSLRIAVENPRNLPFRYFIYDHDREVARGYGAAMDVKLTGTGNRKHQIVLQYLWGGGVQSSYFESIFLPNQLNVSVEQPQLVFPGQQAEIRISVTDQSGKPVPDVDLTAYGFTKKFRYDMSRLPALGIDQRNRKLINSFGIERQSNGGLSDVLDFPAWREKAGLDTIEYYRFLYPDHVVYRFETNPPDRATQFSPFVVRNGEVRPVHVVYLDQKPVYFSWSQNERPYAFRANPGYHRVELRTSDRLYRIDSLYIPANRKLIFSLSDSVQSRQVTITPMPDKLTDAEKTNLYRYIFPYRHSFGSELAYLRQGGEVVLLQPQSYFKHTPARAGNYNYSGGLLAGPVMPNQVQFVLQEGFESYFTHEPFFEYDFLKNILKMRRVEPANRYPTQFWGNAVESFSNWVFSESYLLKERQLQLDAFRRQNARYLYPTSTPSNKSKLQLVLKGKMDFSMPLNILLMSRKDSSFLRIYPGTIQVFHDLAAGDYRIVCMYADATYALLDSLFVQQGGMTYRFIENLAIQPADSFSRRMNQLLERQVFTTGSDKKGIEKEIKQHYQGSFSWSGPGRMIHGRVTDENGEPLIAATVVTSTKSNGVSTDFEGYYSLFLPEGDDAIEIYYVGYQELKITDIGNDPIVDARLTTAGALLQEVLVVDYRVPLIQQDMTTSGQTLTSEQIKNLPTQNINALSGATAGVSIEDGALTVRGSRADYSLYYVDGVRVASYMLPGMEEKNIVKMEILEGEAATALFGPEAANGVVLITTKKGGKGADFDETFLEAAGQASSIRSNFSDYAFWQPKLRTDQEGKATFKVTFPDDITNWRTFVLAMNDRKQTGQSDGSIRSFKPLAARLSLPRFLVQGDSAWAIGKVLNYLPDTVSLRAGFAVGETEAELSDFRFADAVTDSVLLSPTTTDSLQVKFLLQKPDGYTDGEQRSIEVLPLGLERTAGKFLALEGDTTLQWTFPDSLGEVRLYARADVLDVVEEEIARLIHYEYECNEQMASRLKALLAEEQIAKFKNRKFPRKAQAQKLITRILNNQNQQGLWGWWNQSATSYWISTHVLGILAAAKKQGYAVQLPERKITEQAIWELESNAPNARKLELLYLLNSFDAKFKYDNYLPFIEKDTTLSTFDRFRLMELQQRHGLAWNRDTLAHYRQETLFGNVYFSGGETGFSLDRNTLQLTLAAYRILERDSLPDKALLGRIRNYFLEERSRGQWNNTYETAQIIAAILPGLQTRGDFLQAPTLRLAGGATAEVKVFPYQTTIPPGQLLTVSKTGDFPVYFTAYQRYWDAAPHENSEHFSIRTAFAKGGNRLRAGKPETLEVTVDVHKDAQYVMIEVPIPASCSYESKRANFRGEVHREYFRHKTAIFCENLKPGTHRFTIELLPRYAGTFTLNPAKVELMYFPVFQANNSGRKVEVRR